MNKRLYTGISFYEFIMAQLARFGCVVGFVYLLAHFNENPVVITGAALLCVLLLSIIGDDQIVVYQDKITQQNNSLASIIFRSKGQTIKINGIKSAYLQPEASATEIGAAVALSFLLSAVLSKRKGSSSRNKTRPIFFDLKDGGTAQFDTNLEMGKMKKIVDLVNSLIEPAPMVKKSKTKLS